MSDWFRSSRTKDPTATPTGGAPSRPAGSPPKKPALWASSKMPSQLPDSAQGVSAAVVMQHFSRGEIRSLNRQSDDLYARVFQRLRARRDLKRYSVKQVLEMMKQITFSLQSAELTINFKALSYFETPNTWKTYAQMYDLAQRDIVQADGTTRREMRLTGNAMNPAKDRDAADTKVTFGANIKTPGMQGVARFMQTGGLRQVDGTPGGANVYAANNPQFNPKARQQFAALNYGRRPRGGIQGYGFSHFVLNDSLKPGAIYYVGDTFKVEDSNSRVTYDMLFAIAVYASEELMDDLLNACHRHMILQDTDNADRLVEGHVFQEISFSKDIKEMRISATDIMSTTGGLFLEGKVDEAGMEKLREEIPKNARDFAKRNSIKLVWTD